ARVAETGDRLQTTVADVVDKLESTSGHIAETFGQRGEALVARISDTGDRLQVTVSGVIDKLEATSGQISHTFGESGDALV
ncbi:hypothetical protein ABTE21_20915, partial [Acinetobacter baumannii]